MTDKIRCAVIGVGYLGRFHAQKYQSLPNAELVAVCDSNKALCDKVAGELDVEAVYDYKTLFHKVDAVSIVVPTFAHFELAKNFLTQNTHVLIEKPITETIEQAEQLIRFAELNHKILQVGHLERFNAAHLAASPYIQQPKFIESQRIAPFQLRGTDVNVVLELMIHDIDLIQSIVKSPIKSLDAQGTAVLSHHLDIANARIQFNNGCVANVTASRISFKTERKMRIFQPESYVSIDYQQKSYAVFQRGSGEMFPGIPDIERTGETFNHGDALKAEIQAFIHSIQSDTLPIVSGRDGAQALEIAQRITQAIEQSQVDHA